MCYCVLSKVEPENSKLQELRSKAMKEKVRKTVLRGGERGQYNPLPVEASGEGQKEASRCQQSKRKGKKATIRSHTGRK